MRSTAKGPFPWPRGVDAPRCDGCGEERSFLGSLDFRDYPKFGDARGVPAGALVVHVCSECFDATSCWLLPEDDLELRGTGSEDRIEAGVMAETIDFPTPAYAVRAQELSRDPGFAQEGSIYLTFSLFANKIGGHIFWIQGDQTPRDANGTPMRFIGQLLGTDDMELWDSGIIYVFFSEATRQTSLAFQSF
jgi:hypothetical protein